MIYITNKSRAGIPATAAFQSRGLDQYTVGVMSKVTIIGKPTVNQLAYDGYRENIEAFVCATAMKTRVNCMQPSYPVPGDKSTVPIETPQVWFKPLKSMSNDAELRMIEKNKECGIEKVTMGKGKTYIAKTPTKTFLEKIQGSVFDQGNGIEDHSTVKAALDFIKLVEIVDYFLATNTYSFNEDKVGMDDGKGQEGIGARVDILTHETSLSYAPETDGDTIPLKRAKFAANWKTDFEKETLYAVRENSAHFLSRVTAGNSVWSAKPSPLPSKTSWGLPSEVPVSGGHVFPYFEGMVHNDSTIIRECITKHFFRNLPKAGDDPRVAYKTMRADIGIIASTPQGRILAHIMQGIILCMETQTQIYLLFDGKLYLGFCLLGLRYSIFFEGTWHPPMNSFALQEELNTFKTHSQALDAFCSEVLKAKHKAGKDVPADIRELINGPVDVLLTLAAIDVERTDKEDDEQIEKISEAVKSLSFKGNFRALGANGISDGIKQLISDTPIQRELHSYIPHDPAEWSKIDSVYIVLSSFGPTSFSFINRSKGDNIRIPNIMEKEEETFVTVKPKDEKNRAKDSMIVYSKPILECQADWMNVVKSCCVRMDFSERAAGSRGRIFRGEDLSKIYGQLKEGVRTGVIKKVSGKDKEEFEMDMDTGEKTVVTKAPPKSFDDLF
jgi:hypothetical protein